MLLLLLSVARCFCCHSLRFVTAEGCRYCMLPNCHIMLLLLFASDCLSLLRAAVETRFVYVCMHCLPLFVPFCTLEVRPRPLPLLMPSPCPTLQREQACHCHCLCYFCVTVGVCLCHCCSQCLKGDKHASAAAVTIVFALHVLLHWLVSLLHMLLLCCQFMFASILCSSCCY